MQIKTEKGEERDFKIVDTPGEETDQNLLDEWICNSNCIILVYAINEENSFEGLKEYYERIKQNKTEKISIILVGNKSDLIKDNRNIFDLSEISEMLIQIPNSCYYQISCLNKSNFDELKKEIINLCFENEIYLEYNEGIDRDGCVY